MFLKSQKNSSTNIFLGSQLLVSLPLLSATAPLHLPRRPSNAYRLVSDLLCALWGQLRLWSGPTPTCACPQSPQLPELDWFHLREHLLSIQIFHSCRVYQAICRDLIWGFCSWWKEFCSSSLVALPLVLSCGFSPTSMCGPPTGVHSQGCLGGLRSALVRTGHRVGMAAWVKGALVATGAWGSPRPQVWEIRPYWEPFLVPSSRHTMVTPGGALS